MNAITPQRPVMRYHGGKWRLAPWIIAHFPPHSVYCEPFGGSASVLLQKPRARAECYNDLDGQVVNVFRVLRDPASAAELERRIRLTPFARAEFEWCYEPPGDPIDQAHKTIVRSFFGHGSDSVTRSCRTGFRAKMTGHRALPSNSWATWWGSIAHFTDRLAAVLIEQRDAIEVMRQLDTPATLHYVDPPYVASTRSAIANGRGKTHGYKHELTDADHRALGGALRHLEGMVVLSGYDCELYRELFGDWQASSCMTLADGARPRREWLWLNPAAAAAAALPQQLVLHD